MLQSTGPRTGPLGTSPEVAGLSVSLWRVGENPDNIKTGSSSRYAKLIDSGRFLINWRNRITDKQIQEEGHERIENYTEGEPETSASFPVGV